MVHIALKIHKFEYIIKKFILLYYSPVIISSIVNPKAIYVGYYSQSQNETDSFTVKYYPLFYSNTDYVYFYQLFVCTMFSVKLTAI